MSPIPVRPRKPRPEIPWPGTSAPGIGPLAQCAGSGDALLGWDQERAGNSTRMGINTLNRDFTGSASLWWRRGHPARPYYAYSVFANNGVMAGEPVPDEDIKPGFRQLDPSPFCAWRIARQHPL